MLNKAIVLLAMLVSQAYGLEQASKELLKQLEGYSSTPYKCSEGYLTIGYGHRLFSGFQTVTQITKSEAEKLLEADIASASKSAMAIFGGKEVWDSLKPSARDVLVIMVFQVGRTGASKFVKMRKAIELRNYQAAAREMLDSQWHRQTPSRVRLLASMLVEGK